MTVIFQQDKTLIKVAVESIKIHPTVTSEMELRTGPSSLLQFVIHDESDSYVLPSTVFDGTPFALFQKIDIEPLTWSDTISVKEFINLIELL